MILMRVVCAWCKVEIRREWWPGDCDAESHGLCDACDAQQQRKADEEDAR